MKDKKDNISHAATILRVRDVQKAARFYHEQLGFNIEFEYGDPVYYIGVRRAEITVHLTQHEDLDYQNGNPALYFFVRDVDSLYQEFVSKGVKKITQPANQEYGMRDFDVWDLDGYQLAFGTGLELLEDNQ